MFKKSALKLKKNAKSARVKPELENEKSFSLKFPQELQRGNAFGSPKKVRGVAEAVLPARLARGSGRARVWSAACATGEEPLTLAMLLEQRGMLDGVEIVASDRSCPSATSSNPLGLWIPFTSFIPGASSSTTARS